MTGDMMSEELCEAIADVLIHYCMGWELDEKMKNLEVLFKLFLKEPAE